MRPIWRGRLTFAPGSSARSCDRSTYTSMSSGRRPEPLTSAAFGRRPCFAKSAAFVTLVEFVAILEPSVSLPRAVPRLPRPSSPNRGALLRRGIPLLAIRRASARGPRTGPARLAQLDTRPLGLLLTRFPFCAGQRQRRLGLDGSKAQRAARNARSRAEERPSGWRREARRGGSSARRRETQAGQGGVSADAVTRRGPHGGRRERRRGERGRPRGLGGKPAKAGPPRTH